MTSYGLHCAVVEDREGRAWWQILVDNLPLESTPSVKTTCMLSNGDRLSDLERARGYGRVCHRCNCQRRNRYTHLSCGQSVAICSIS